MLAFNQYAYGGWDKTGYASGEITFSFGALSPNLSHMPAYLLRAMPMLLLGLIAIGWIAVRAVMAHREADPAGRVARRRDALIAGILGGGWLGFWGLYLSYNWTAQMSAQSHSALHVIRFYLPALGLIALLGAWLLARLVRMRMRAGAWSVAAILLALVLAGSWSYQIPVTTAAGPGGRLAGGALPQGAGPPGSLGTPPRAPTGRGYPGAPSLGARRGSSG